MKAGTVVDLVEAEAAVRQAVDAAERGAGVHIESVIISVSAGRLASELYEASVPLRGTAGEADIERVLAVGSRHSVRQGRAVLHSLPIGFALDDVHPIRDPRGMLGRRLGVDMHVVTVDAAAARNLMLTVEQGHLTVEAMVANNLAMYRITVGEHPDFRIPYFGFRGSPVGIDVLKVVETGIVPLIDGGLAGKGGGQIGAGVLMAPIECFKAAAAAHATLGPTTTAAS